MRLPRHLAIIMDGNGRWAETHSHSRVYGHVKGATVARNIIEASAQIGIEHLTLFTFSTENWLRPQKEVGFLMELLFRRLKRELPVLMKNNIKFHCIGELERMPKGLQERTREVIEATAGNTGMKLTFALSYGGRQEILSAAQLLAEKVQKGELSPSQISESDFTHALQSSFLPDPDLIIRTSNEYRLSNFFLWQAAYSELYIAPVNWPDFTAHHLAQALNDFSNRDRRFGRVKATASFPSTLSHQ